MIVLAGYEDGERSIRIVELLHDRSRAYLEGDALYTHVDHAGENLLAYVETMRTALARSAQVLLLGTAGGALATALSGPGASVTAVDNLAWAFTAARRWFGLPNQIQCIHADALTFLRRNTRRWTGIAIDLFCGLEVPGRFMTAEFGDLLRDALAPGGVLVWNIADNARSPSVAWVLQSMLASGLAAEAIEVSADGYSNTVVVRREFDQVPAREDRGQSQRERRE